VNQNVSALKIIGAAAGISHWQTYLGTELRCSVGRHSTAPYANASGHYATTTSARNLRQKM
jgi:hypothetical protein